VNTRMPVGILALSMAAAPLTAQQGAVRGLPADSAGNRADAAAMESMAMPMAAEAHLRLSAARAPNAADSARAAALAATLRTALEKYRDVHAAEADGYRIFLPNVPQSVYHYTNWRYGLEAAFGFDPAKPTALLYRKTPSGVWELTGAMYTARAGLGEDDLDRRVPLSVARWHQHVNWCLPPRGRDGRWLEVEGSRPRFGPQSPIATREACERVGGRFVPRLFGWMVHANVFAGDDPGVIWGMEGHEH
jgi:hypothetical protein